MEGRRHAPGMYGASPAVAPDQSQRRSWGSDADSWGSDADSWGSDSNLSIDVNDLTFLEGLEDVPPENAMNAALTMSTQDVARAAELASMLPGSRYPAALPAPPPPTSPPPPPPASSAPPPKPLYPFMKPSGPPSTNPVDHLSFLERGQYEQQQMRLESEQKERNDQKPHQINR